MSNSLNIQRGPDGTTIEVKGADGAILFSQRCDAYIDELYAFEYIRARYGLEEKPYIVLTGVEKSVAGGWMPQFDVVSHGRVMAQAGAGFRFPSEEEAQDAGRRAVAYFDAHGCFPNMCAKF